MPRVQPRFLSSGSKTTLLDELWTMIALLETKDEVRSFFKDLLSETEAVMIARRIQIAKLLLQGFPYEKIKEKLGTSNATISGVHQWLQGGFGGYEKLVPRLEQELKRRQVVSGKQLESKVPYTIEWAKKRYPLHFLLLNLFDRDSFRPPKKLRR